jgi:hypothetical protein
MARPRRPLSNSASTASWSMRFSLRTMMSGARSSISRFNRLFRLMTRRYRSFRSEVAKRPPSSGTSGRSSGGITGTTPRIIQSGRAPLSAKASISLSRLTSFLRLASEVVSLRSARSRTASLPASMPVSICLTASAPMPTENASSPNSSILDWYWSSVRSWWSLRSVSPGSSTT